MRKVTKIKFDYWDWNFQLIALHSTTEDYQLAFALNKSVNIALKRTDDFVLNSVAYPLFFYDDLPQNIQWTLIPNRLVSKGEKVSYGFFEEEPTQTTILITKLPKVDYFLKITNGCEKTIQNCLEKLTKTSIILASYEVNIETLPHSDALLF